MGKILAGLFRVKRFKVMKEKTSLGNGGNCNLIWGKVLRLSGGNQSISKNFVADGNKIFFVRMVIED